MRTGLYLSIALHTVAILLLLLGLPFLSFKDINTDYAYVVDVVPVSELTNVKVKASNRKDNTEQQTNKAPKASAEQQKEEEKSNTKESSKKATETEKPAEKIPDKNVKEEKKKEEPKKDEKKPDKAKAKDEPKKDEKPKKKDDSFEKSILKSLDSDAKKTDNKKVEKDFKDLADALKGDTNKDYNPNLPMSISEIDAIKSQIVKAWNTTSFSGANDKGMQVIINIELDMDGNVIKVTPQKMSNNSPYYQVFVESAIRAVKKASPLQNLTKEKYHSWKEIEFRFDSAGMIF